MWYRTKGKAKGKAYVQQPGQPEPQGMRAPLPGIPMYAPNKRGQIRAVYRNSDGRLVAFSSSGSEEEPAEGGSSNDEEPAVVAEQAEEESVAVAQEKPDSDDFSPWPPLPREQVGLLTHERCTHSSDEDDDAPDRWHEWRRQQEAIHAALGYPAGEDDGAGVGDLGDYEVRHWREPDPDEMFLPRSRAPGDTPPSGLEDLSLIHLTPFQMVMVKMSLKSLVKP